MNRALAEARQIHEVLQITPLPEAELASSQERFSRDVDQFIDAANRLGRSNVSG